MARRKNNKVFKLLTYLLILVVVVVGAYFTYDQVFKEDASSTKIPETKKEKPTEPQDEVYNLKFLATGDGLLHSVIHRAYLKDGVYDFTKTVENIKDIVSKYDIAYYNQETPMGDNTIKYGGYPQFYVPKEFGDAMIDAGFNTVSLASNHSYDVGEKGVINTLNYFKTTDVLYNGMNASLEEMSNYNIKEKNNITYTMLAYTTLDNGLRPPSSKSYLVNKYDKERVKKDIEAVRDKVDVLIVAMHWGVEYVHKPTDEQKEIAEYLADLGVDIVVGNHSHVLQPITKIDDTIVMYSLGNFISNQYGKEDWNRVVGFLATLDITKTVHPNGDIEMNFDNLGGELIFTKYKGHPTNTATHTEHRVIPFSKMDDDFLLSDSYAKNDTKNDFKRVYEKYVGILESMGTDLNVAPLKNSN